MFVHKCVYFQKHGSTLAHTPMCAHLYTRIQAVTKALSNFRVLINKPEIEPSQSTCIQAFIRMCAHSYLQAREKETVQLAGVYQEEVRESLPEYQQKMLMWAGRALMKVGDTHAKRQQLHRPQQKGAPV